MENTSIRKVHHVRARSLFIYTKPHAPELLAKFETNNFNMGRGRDHEGQGTANRCLMFNNAYFEAIWMRDKQEMQLEEPSKAKMYQRATWRESGYSPFGLALRGQGEVGFETWDYQPAFLPQGSTIQVARNRDCVGEPFIFVMPDGIAPIQRPAEHPRSYLPFLNHKNGVQEICKVKLTLPVTQMSPALQYVAQLDIMEICLGDAPLMELFLSASPTQCMDLRESDPLMVWY